MLRAPYTNRECVYYRMEINQGQAHQRKDLILDDRRDFRITDISGVAEVLVGRATFEIANDFVEMERASRLSETALELARKHGWTVEDIAQVTITEGIVPVGASIDIVGRAVRVPRKEPGTAERSYRDRPETLPVFSDPTVIGKSQEPVWIGQSKSDLD